MTGTGKRVDDMVNISLIGLGQRGQVTLERLGRVPNANVLIRCDIETDWREAATHPTKPAVELARVVRRLQSQRALVADLRPLTRFIATINKTFGTKIKYDSFSKHFRN